jgi:hypothetical protein
MMRFVGTVAKSPKIIFAFHLSDILPSISPPLIILFAEGRLGADSLIEIVPQCRPRRKPNHHKRVNICDVSHLMTTRDRIHDCQSQPKPH